MSKTYLAVTIGPIYKTFAQAKRTRAVWAASYLFSWLIKQIVSETRPHFDIRLPFAADIQQSKYGSGMYADRVYFVTDEEHDKHKLDDIIDAIIQKLATDVGQGSLTFLQSYFNIHTVEIAFEPGDDGATYPLEKINMLLDHKELKQNYAFSVETNPLFEYLGKKINENTLLKKDAFGARHDRKFKSLPEIASASLRRQFPVEYEAALKKELRNEDIELFDDEKLQKVLKPHHKYYAVIYADGDNIGKVLEKVQIDQDKLKAFSKQLFEFAQKAEQTIADYGGNGIYLGGEDILTFAPIACVPEKAGQSPETIFDLIGKIDTDFENTLGNFASVHNVPVPTLSYGIMIAYIKFPLKEAMGKAYYLLEEAKKMDGKNRVGLCFQKHSGQRMECFIDKNRQTSYTKIQQLTKHYISHADKNDALISG